MDLINKGFWGLGVLGVDAVGVSLKRKLEVLEVFGETVKTVIGSLM